MYIVGITDNDFDSTNIITPGTAYYNGHQDTAYDTYDVVRDENTGKYYTNGNTYFELYGNSN